MSAAATPKPHLIGMSMKGIGAAVPGTVITNDDLAKLVDTSDEWIRSRTGIGERHVVSGDETVNDLAIHAAKDALASAGMTGDDIDLIIVACSTPDTIYPAVSALVQQAIGANRAAGFDISMACSGFVYALVTAQQFIRTGMHKTILIVAADVHSRRVDWYDRSTCVLFADGGGAMIVQANENGEDDLLSCEIGMDGNKAKEISLQVEFDNCPLVKPCTPAQHPFVTMNGQEVYKFAVTVVPESLDATIRRAGVSVSDLDFLILHQANLRIMDSISDRLHIPKEKVLFNLDKYGNTSAASIPLVINEFVLNGTIKPGNLIAICGYGAGLAWGSAVFRWNCVDHRIKNGASTERPILAAV